MDLESYLDARGGIATVSELAVALKEDEAFVRRWARDHNVRRCGATFVFSLKNATQLQQEGDQHRETAFQSLKRAEVALREKDESRALSEVVEFLQRMFAQNGTR